jgi:HSP20 family protein
MKTVTLYRPSFQNVLEEFDRYFDSFFGNSSHDAHIPTAPFKAGGWLPAVDLRETENAYFLEAELAGYDEKDIEVHVDNNRLSIASKQVEEEEKTEGVYLIKERGIRSFSRMFKLPENADSSAITAAFKNGVLTLEIKKRVETQKRLIKING